MFVKQGGFLESEEISSDGRDRLFRKIEVQFEDKCYSSRLLQMYLKKLKVVLGFVFLHTGSVFDMPVIRLT